MCENRTRQLIISLICDRKKISGEKKSRNFSNIQEGEKRTHPTPPPTKMWPSTESCDLTQADSAFSEIGRASFQPGSAYAGMYWALLSPLEVSHPTNLL